jgi:uncharacterized protein
MAMVFQTGVGAVLSADIAVPEYAREVQFYTDVLTTGTEPLWNDDLMNNLGLPIIGLGPQSAEYARLPLQWMPHIQVADVATSAQRAVAMGGEELLHARTDEGVSEWAVMLDPNGAAFGLIPELSAEAIPPEGRVPASKAAGVGRIGWLDLTVQNAQETRDFYQQVIGWKVAEVAVGNGADRYSDFSMLDANGTAAAGVCHARGGNADLPPVWLLYLPVGNLAESLHRVEALGGRICQRVQDQSKADQYAVIQDPVGVHLALMAV